MRIQPATSQPVHIEPKAAPTPKAAPAAEQPAATVKISKAALEAATKPDADGDGDGR
jgi:hypothetical protein